MGTTAGTSGATNEKNQRRFGWCRWILGLSVAAGLTACAATKPVALAPDSWERATPKTPQMLARLFYGPRSITDALLLEMQDVALPARRWTRCGNGMISLRAENDRGRRLPALQCGGQLVVVGEPGTAWRLWVRNETDVPIEVLPSVDGLDLETGKPADLALRGRLLGPRESVAFASMAGAAGKETPLTFREVKDTSALYRMTTTGTLGMVVVAVFLPKDVDSFDSQPLLQRRLPSLHGGPGALPNRRYQPMLLPYQYR